MLIKFYGQLDYLEPLELIVDNLKLALAGIKHHYGQEVADIMLQDKLYYILANSQNEADLIAIHPDLVTMNFDHYDTLLIIPDIGGEVPAAAVAAIIGLAETSFATIAITAVINIALSIALSAVMQLLSPTPEFSSDPAVAQSAHHLESNLFNGAPNIREQGGSVPLIYGNPHCGGVLISAGISTEEVTI